MKNITAIPGVALALALIGLGTFAAFKSMTASGKVDYCYTQAYGWSHTEQMLRAHRDWREDRNLGTFPSIESAAEAAKKYGCELK